MRKSLRGAATALLIVAAGAGCAGNRLPVDAGPEQTLAHAEQKLEQGKYLDAAESLEFFLRTFPGSSRTPYAKLLLGDARFGLEEYVLATGYYRDVVSDYPASPWVERARFRIALCAYESIYPYNRDQSETERAILLLEDFLRDYPDSRFEPEAEEALADCRERLARREFEAGRFYEKQNRQRSAYIEYQFVLDNYPGTEWAPLAAFRIGEIYRSRERWEEAETYYRRVLRDWPESPEALEAQDLLETLEVARLEETEEDR
jgi:outer membrane protein assembly factor BamD